MNKKWALFFSGKGSNLEALLKRYHRSWVHPPVLVTNNPKALGLKVAKAYGFDALILPSPINYRKLSAELKTKNVDCIFLLGFLKIVPASFLSDWSGSVYNLHPSLLPSYPGLNSIERAFTEKQPIGVTIHVVNEGVDEGKILLQSAAIKPKDYDPLSLEEVTAMVHSIEHQLVCDFIPMGEKNIGSKI